MQDSIIKKLQIVNVIPETADAKTFVLQPMEGWQPIYKPGQFITLVFYTHHAGEKRRSFSISSSNDEPLAITVKKVDNGEFSRMLNYKAAIGDILFSAGISGFFTMPEEDRYESVCFLAAGSGITPCFALIKTLLQTTGKKIVLIYSNRSAADTIFYHQLIDLAARSHGRFIIDFLFSSSNNILKSRLNNSLLTTMLAQYGKASREEILCYICGPVEYMDTVSITLLTEGIPKANIRKENFVHYKPELAELPPDTDPHKVSIKLKDRTVSFTVQYPVSILHQAQQEGIALPYSCESGQCGSCAAKCKQGRVWIAYNEVLTDREINQGLILTCQGFPIGGDVELEY